MTISEAREVIKTEADGLMALLDQVDDQFNIAVDLIMACPSRVIITGIGKSGIIGQKIAATLNSTGTSSFFLHPVEAMHGDLGIVATSDVILAISYSGETSELTILLPTFKNRGNRLIALTGNRNSSLAQAADANLQAKIPKEACPLGLAPTSSTTAALAMGDALAVVLLNRKQFKESDFRRNHPGGSLGERLKAKVSEVMITGDQIPMVKEGAPLIDAMEILNTKNLGAVLVVNDKMITIGIITDGDIRRLVVNLVDVRQSTVSETMTPAPKTIAEGRLAADALSIMQHHEVTVLPVVNSTDQLTGMLHLHDLLGKGEFSVLI
jgi:arabinose-5-phosphate isomerase